MQYPAELVLRNYVPDSIEPGMFFITKTQTGENVDPIHIWKFENYMNLTTYTPEEIWNALGYPVELYIIDPTDHSILATPSQIGWFDPGEDSDEYRDIELKDINTILENEGMIEIELEDVAFQYRAINVVLEDDKVIIRIL